MEEDETVGWHHWLSGHEFEPALKVGNGQGTPFIINGPITSLWLQGLSTSAFFFHFLAAPHSVWDLSCPTWDGTCVPGIGSTESSPLNC